MSSPLRMPLPAVVNRLVHLCRQVREQVVFSLHPQHVQVKARIERMADVAVAACQAGSGALPNQ